MARGVVAVGCTRASTHQVDTERLVIDVDELVEARRDPSVHAMLDRAVAYGEQLEAKGRNH